MADLCSIGLRPGTKDDKALNRWVPFPNGKNYLLPVVQRELVYAPAFNDDGTVSVQPICHDQQLQTHLDAFLGLAEGYQGDGTLLIDPLSGYSAFMSLVKYLLDKNYELSPDEVRGLLTVNQTQVATLFNTIWQHVLGA